MKLLRVRLRHFRGIDERELVFAREGVTLVNAFADVFAWLTTLANINDVDLTKAMSKYTDRDRVKGVKH